MRLVPVRHHLQSSALLVSCILALESARDQTDLHGSHSGRRRVLLCGSIRITGRVGSSWPPTSNKERIFRCRDQQTATTAKASITRPNTVDATHAERKQFARSGDMFRRAQRVRFGAAWIAHRGRLPRLKRGWRHDVQRIHLKQGPINLMPWH